MSRIGTIARRTFLVGSAALVGGVAFGVYAVRKPAPNPLSPGAGEVALNPFVMINQDGVTLIAPRAEMGQGVHTTWAALIAEELDVDLADVRVIHGPAAKAYYNSAMLGDVMPLKEYEMSDFMHSVSSTLGEFGKLFSLQATGGSTSMKDGFVRMRVAGATARETLKEAAAQKYGLFRKDLRTEAGHVILPDDRKIPYTDLAEASAGIEVREPDLRDARDWKMLGTSQPRVDMVAKSTGTAEFGVDVRLPGQKFAAVRMTPKLGGAMKGYDDTDARAMPGVEKIVDLGTGVAVVANNTWLAQQAVDAIEIEWGDAPYPAETDDIFAEISAAFDAKPNSTLRNEGDADTVPPGATELSAEYKVPYLAHATMEPMNATALYTGDALEIWCGHQAPTIAKSVCAGLAGLDSEAVSFHTTFLGGGFGRRGELDFASYATQVAMAMPNTPVQVTWSREEDMRHDFYRPGALARFKGAVGDGKALLMDGQIAGQSAVFQMMERATGMSGMGADKIHVDGAYNQPFAIPNYRIRGYLADMPLPVGSWRSVGASFNGFFHDTFLDEMAHAAGRDPLEFRIELARSEHAPSAAVLEAVGKMSGWTGKTPDGVGRGVGFTHSFGTPVAEVIEVVDEDGTIRISKAWIACDVGIALDPSIIEAQMISGMNYGLSAACFGEITFSDGEVEQNNFPDYDAVRMHTAPHTEVSVLEIGAHLGGVGEPGTPPSMPALGNALFDLTGIRARELPFSKTFDLLI